MKRVLGLLVVTLALTILATGDFGEALAASSATTTGRTTSYPEKGKPITLLVPYGVGGATDSAGRIMARGMEKILGTSIQVVNKPGATGQVAYTELSKAKPDGYTISVFTFPSMIIHTLDIERQARYTRKNFQPIMSYGADINLLAVRADSPYKTLKEFVDASKADPKKLTVGCIGILSPPHIGMIKLGQVTGLKFNMVQFNSNVENNTALLGGKVDSVAQGASGTFPYWKAGQMRILGIMDDRRYDLIPDAKTMQEEGYEKCIGIGIHGLLAPAGTPKEIVDALYNAAKKAFDSDETKKMLKDIAMAERYMDTNQVEKFWSEQETELKPIVEFVRKK